MPSTRAAIFAAALLLCAAPAAMAAGYLDPQAAPDMTRVLPPPPAPGTGVAADDAKAYTSSRSLEGQPRWALAQNDVEQTPEAAFLDFACALGVTLDDSSAPVLQNIFAKVRTDARAFVDPPKDHWARHRPYVDLPGNICVDKTDALAKAASYPSGHSTLSWAWGLILAELAPDRATEILSRARAYAESRVVCGVHYPSDIEAGRTNGSALVAALHANADFRADMDKARAELVAARKVGGIKPDAGRCKIEDDAETHRPW
jgi:acid phosphatase (class A)